MRFAGYAAIFDRPDGARDTIAKGAFIASLKRKTSSLPLFWQHRPEKQIGFIERIKEDDFGLRVIAQIDNPKGIAGKMVSAGNVTGLSFGYTAVFSRNNEAGRILEEVEIHEVSLVTHPLQHAARVHLVT